VPANRGLSRGSTARMRPGPATWECALEPCDVAMGNSTGVKYQEMRCHNTSVTKRLSGTLLSRSGEVGLDGHEAYEQGSGNALVGPTGLLLSRPAPADHIKASATAVRAPATTMSFFRQYCR
jgi:hypothetical protein